MKELWYVTLVMLMLGVLGSLANLSSPTSAFTANLPPKWDASSAVLQVNGQASIDLSLAFFDPDGDPLSFSVSPSEGVSAGVYGDTLIVYAERDGFVVVTASDGKNIVSKTIQIKAG